MTRAELVQRVRARIAEDEVMGTPAPVADVLRWMLPQLEDLSDVPQASTTEEPDRLLDAQAVADRMGVTKSYVYDHHHAWPFTVRVGGKLRFSERGLTRALALRPSG